ncbi:MAG: flagellar export chaperone FliS [Sphingomonadaceae bacterium]|nr:flagellar export chaperone FliS [Sphingomonadaceae bacterium]
MSTPAARARAYRETNVASRVAGANPHQLVQILFDEALADLAAGRRAAEIRDYAQKSRHLSHAATIVAALEGCLDHRLGGELAANLALVYAFVRARILRGAARNDLAALDEAAATLAEIAEAWATIQPRPATTRVAA